MYAQSSSINISLTLFYTTNLPYNYHFQVDFYWINREQKSFEWFVKLLSQLEIEQSEQDGVMGHFLDMHMYITSALQRTDMKAVGLQLALDLLHEKVKDEYFILFGVSEDFSPDHSSKFDFLANIYTK